MKRYISLFTIVMLLPFLIQAQYLSDAFRFSNFQIQGTARSAGMGNAMGALGGDFTSLSINPAGSGLYRSGEFVITPVFNLNKTELTMGGNKFSDNHSYFTLSNIGVVGQLGGSLNNTGLISVNYGFGLNRLADFNGTAFANNNGSPVSFLDDIANWATGEQLNQAYLEQDFNQVEYRDWPAKLAWDTYLMDPARDNQGNEIDNQYVAVLNENELVNQRKSYSVEGGINEYVLNLGMNFNHMLYLGATVGIHDISYRRVSLYDEQFQNSGSFAYTDNYTVDGQGYNIKIGAIYRPVNALRLGIAFHSPTYYRINEESMLKMNSSLDKNYSAFGVNSYNYDFYNPTKIIASAALVFNKVGLISGDIEYQNYSNVRFRKGGDGTEGFSDLNHAVDQEFKDVVNFRIGGEAKLTDQFTFRVGGEFYGNPYRRNNLDGDSFLREGIPVVSAGLGYAANNFSINAAYRNAWTGTSESNDQPNFYQLTQDNKRQQLMLTLGFRF